MYCQLEQALQKINAETETELVTSTQKLIRKYSECIQKENQDCQKFRVVFSTMKQKINEHKDQFYKCIEKESQNQSFQQCIDVFAINQINIIKKCLINIENELK